MLKIVNLSRSKCWLMLWNHIWFLLPYHFKNILINSIIFHSHWAIGTQVWWWCWLFWVSGLKHLHFWRVLSRTWLNFQRYSWFILISSINCQEGMPCELMWLLDWPQLCRFLSFWTAIWWRHLYGLMRWNGSKVTSDLRYLSLLSLFLQFQSASQERHWWF